MEEKDIKILLRFRVWGRDGYHPDYWVFFMYEGHTDTLLFDRKIPKKSDILKRVQYYKQIKERAVDWKNCEGRRLALKCMLEDATKQGLRENALSLVKAYNAADFL